MIDQNRQRSLGRVDAVDALLRLAKEAEAAGVVLEEDPVGALMAPEAAAGKAWQDTARDIMTALQVCPFAPLKLVHFSRKVFQEY